MPGATRPGVLDGTQCRECMEPPEEGRRRCAACAERHRQRSAARRAELKSRGKCVVCGKRAVKGMTVCKEHREYYRQRDEQARQLRRESQS